MSVGDTRFYDYPKWLPGNDIIENVDSLDTLGVIFNNDCNSNNHVNTGVQISYRSYYSLRNFGFSYPGENNKYEQVYFIILKTWKHVKVISLSKA